MTLFCREYQISRKTFYAIRRQAREDGPNTALEPRSRRPRNSPAKTPDEVIRSALRVRQSLEDEGWDFGPISVHDRMKLLGMPAPSPATLARAFRREGVARLQPQKKPRAAWKRFTYPAPNDLWQIDAFELTLATGKRCTIFQVIDDHSRFQVSSLAAYSENGQAALEVVRTAVNRYGAPARFLSDNGSALNPSRRGLTSELLTYLQLLGVDAITGRPGHPTTQGKNERFHQTLQRWLLKQPDPETLDELQVLLDQFEHDYNMERPHQSLPERITPFQAWTSTPRTPPPEPPLPNALPPLPPRVTTSQQRNRWKDDSEGSGRRKVNTIGLIQILGIHFSLGRAWAGRHVFAVWDPETVTVASDEGVVLIVWASPGPTGTPTGTRYLGQSHALKIYPGLSTPSPMS